MSKQAPQADVAGSIEIDSDAAAPLPRELTWRSGLAVAGAACSYFITVGFLNAFGVFQEYYFNNVLRGHSNFQIAWLGSFSSFALFFFAPPAGLLADKYGPRLPIAFGVLCILVAVFMISLCKAYYQFFLAQGVLLGVGMSFVSIPAISIVPRYFRRHRGFATGMSVAGSSTGGVIWPIVFDQLLHHDDVGFPWAMRIAGFIVIPICVVAILAVRVPKAAGQKDDDEKGQNEEPSHEQKPKPKKDLSVLRKPPFVFLCIGEFFAIFGFFPPLFYVSTYAVSLGMSSSIAFYLVSILNAASLFGRILPGIVADRYGRFNLFTLSCLSAAAIVFCWTPATSVAGVVVWAIAYGFASGAILSLQLACATTLVGDESAGAAVGAVMGSTSLASLFGTPVAGEIVKHGFLPLSMFSGGCLLVGTCFMVASRLAQSRSLTARI